MGADLYIPAIHDKLYEEYKLEFDAAVMTRDGLQADLEDKEAEEADEQEIVALKKAIETAQEDVHNAYESIYDDAGYFRDSYNAASVFWRLGMSWWRDIEEYAEINPNQDYNGKPYKNWISPESCLKLADKIKKTQLQLVSTVEELEQLCASTKDDEDGTSAVDSWNKYWTEKKAHLIDFLQRAAACGSGVRFSVQDNMMELTREAIRHKIDDLIDEKRYEDAAFLMSEALPVLDDISDDCDVAVFADNEITDFWDEKKEAHKRKMKHRINDDEILSLLEDAPEPEPQHFFQKKGLTTLNCVV